MKRIWAAMLALLLLAILAAGCSARSDRDHSGAAPAETQAMGGQQGSDFAAPDRAPEADVPPAARLGQDVLAGGLGNKIIKSGHMTLETLEFEETTEAIQRRVQQQGGFMESSSIQGVSRLERAGASLRRAQFKVRIPSRLFEQFLLDMGDLGNVIWEEKFGRDISAEYFDTEGRVRSLRVQEDRLLAILAEAEKLQDILELERELSRVRHELERLTVTLRQWDSLIDFSTLDITVQEVREIKVVEPVPVTLWEKMAQGFTASLRNAGRVLEFMAVFVISALPFLVLSGIFGLAVYGIVRLILRKKVQ